ncbi:MAG: hypothetical protein WDM85_16395 [Caulobacteraceae bacterium]
MDSEAVVNIVTPVALGMIALGVGGISFMALRAFATASRRRARLSGGAVVAAEDDGGGVAEIFSGAVSGVRRLGDRMAIQDPAQLSTVRTKLMLAGYYSREAAAIYLGVKAATMFAAIVGIVLMLPLGVRQARRHAADHRRRRLCAGLDHGAGPVHQEPPHQARARIPRRLPQTCSTCWSPRSKPAQTGRGGDAQ